MRKFALVILSMILLLAVFPVGSAAAAPSITAAAAVVIDFDSGEVLYEHNMRATRAPSSMSKVLTAFVVYEEIAAGKLSFDTIVKVSSNAAAISTNRSIQGSYVPMTAGRTYSVDSILHLMLLPSGNAACVVMAEHIAGTESEFAKRMNETGKSIGMTLNFNNSHGGIPNYTTAYSMGLLIREFIRRYPDILRITSRRSFVFDGRTYTNTNLLIQNGSNAYSGADGFKTGTTREGGYCLSSTAKRNGKRIISIVMGSRNNSTRYSDSRALLDYGFAEAARRDAEAAKVEEARVEAARVFVSIDGIPLESDVAPQMIDSRVMVPIRAIFEAFGARVEWNKTAQTVTAFANESDVITLTVGSRSIRKNGQASEIDVPPQLVGGGRVLVPVRFVAEALGAQVQWNSSTRTVNILSDNSG